MFLVPPILGNARTNEGEVQNRVTACRCRLFPKEQMLSVVLGTKETILFGGFSVLNRVSVTSNTKDIKIYECVRKCHITHFFGHNFIAHRKSFAMDNENLLYFVIFITEG